MRAITFSDVEIVRMLLQHGGNPNQKDKSGHTALYRLLHSFHPEEHTEIIALLKAAGAIE